LFVDAILIVDNRITWVQFPVDPYIHGQSLLLVASGRASGQNCYNTS